MTDVTNWNDPAQRRAYVKGLLDAGVRRVRDQDGNVWERKITLWHHVGGPDFRKGWRGRMPSLNTIDEEWGPVLEL